MKIDSQGGIQYQTPEELKVAKKADLLTLPLHLQHGVNCSNCRFYKKMNEHVGHCANVDVQLPVTPAQCCSLYDTAGTIKSWEHQEP